MNTQVHTGFPVTYEWDFADGSSLLTETLGQVNHSFSSVGRYNVTVRAHNELSQDIAWVSYKAEDDKPNAISSDWLLGFYPNSQSNQSQQPNILARRRRRCDASKSWRWKHNLAQVCVWFPQIELTNLYAVVVITCNDLIWQKYFTCCRVGHRKVAHKTWQLIIWNKAYLLFQHHISSVNLLNSQSIWILKNDCVDEIQNTLYWDLIFGCWFISNVTSYETIFYFYQYPPSITDLSSDPG